MSEDMMSAAQAANFENRTANFLKEQESRIIRALVRKVHSKDGLDPQEALIQIGVIAELRRLLKQLKDETLLEIDELENSHD